MSHNVLCRGLCHVFFMFLSAIIFLWFVRFSYFFLWKYVINSLDFGCLTAKLSPHRFPCLFDHFLIFFWAEKQFFPFYYFPCPLFKLAVNGSSRNVFLWDTEWKNYFKWTHFRRDIRFRDQKTLKITKTVQLTSKQWSINITSMIYHWKRYIFDFKMLFTACKSDKMVKNGKQIKKGTFCLFDVSPP